ncbi:MAG TPA: LysM peptidoglycan-binding domain-containing protein [Bacteroidetes bacterium]|nr:LysM peptidoglycan-binding domain-containing protein [Bacteroidota bacterium]
MFKKNFVVIPFLLLTVSAAFSQSQNSDYLNYIEKYKKIAIKEMDRAGIPASIKLAQALLESNAGRSTLAKKANNHFGIKCGSNWKGRTFHREDDDYDEFGNLQKSCFRRYRRAKDSFIAHSEFLRDPKKANRYGFLFRLDGTDYKRWARGLKRAGYATSATYDKKLINLIKTYKLYEYDKPGGGNSLPDRPDEGIAGLDLRRVNSAKVVFAKNNITVQEIADKSGVSIKSLKRYNEMLPDVNEALPDNYRVFLQPKRNRFRGKRNSTGGNGKWHYVKEGETLFDISQEYGVKLFKLRKRNRIPKGAEPQAGERLKLRGWRVKKGERPRLTTEPAPEKVPVIIDDGGDFMEEDITPQDPNPMPGDRPTYEPGQPTTQPQPTDPAPPATNVRYTVVKGDTLYSISRRFGLTVDQLMRMNNLNSTALSIGQVLNVK